MRFTIVIFHFILFLTLIFTGFCPIQKGGNDNVTLMIIVGILIGLNIFMIV